MSVLHSCLVLRNADKSRRVRQLKEEPYSQKEAEAAAGLTTDNGRRKEDDYETEMAEAT